MSDLDVSSEGTWMPKPPPVVHDDAVSADQPEAVTNEEAFLDSIVSHIDDDTADMVALRDKVSTWYASCDADTAKGDAKTVKTARETPSAAKEAPGDAASA
jgi:hypothetical protein